MKKFLSIISVFVLLLTSCQKQENELILKPTQEISKEVLKFYDENENVLSYDFVLNNEVVDYDLIQYKLVNGKWEKVYNFFGHALNDSIGSVAFNAQTHVEHITITTVVGPKGKEQIGSGHGTNEDFLPKSFKIISLNEEVSVTYEEEIPLFIQIDTEDEINIEFNVDPDQLAKQFENYTEDVYLITIVFDNQYIK